MLIVKFNQLSEFNNTKYKTKYLNFFKLNKI